MLTPGSRPTSLTDDNEAAMLRGNHSSPPPGLADWTRDWSRWWKPKKVIEIQDNSLIIAAKPLQPDQTDWALYVPSLSAITEIIGEASSSTIAGARKGQTA